MTVEVKKVVIVTSPIHDLEYRIVPDSGGISIFYKDAEEMTMYLPYELARAFYTVLGEMLSDNRSIK